MARGPIRKERDIRREFNALLDNVFKKAEEIYKTGKRSQLDLSELEKMAFERRHIKKEGQEPKGGGQITITKDVDQMKKWVATILGSLKKDFVPKESAINEAMVLYKIFEDAKTPEKLGDGLKKWVGG